MKAEYRIAFEEVYEIFKLMPQELLNKIPVEFHKIIEEERDKEYFANIQEPIENCKLTNETIILLGLIYRDFLCPSEERERLKEKDARELEKIQLEMKNEISEKYNANSIFNNNELESEAKVINKVEIKEQEKEEKSISLVHERWYKKLLNIIKRLFKNK